MIPIVKKITFLQFYLVFCYLVLLGFITWALPMEDQDYYLQEIINRNHYYSYPDPNEELSPFTEQPREKDLKPSAEIEESPKFKPGKKEFKSKKIVKPRKDKSTLETPPAKNGNKKGEKNKKSNERTPDGDYERRNTGEDSRQTGQLDENCLLSDFVCNNSIHSSIDISPFQTVHGYQSCKLRSQAPVSAVP